ncbi:MULTISPECIES: acetyl-CoA carboxylase biotin carboxylase subunit family protein [Halomonas]|uniref:Biotin carboxylation domain-containing protein n=1 Tax=Halomonas halophila TaxID=29573 RepID=A0ABQ0U156_9GAMM|nr:MULTISPECIES: hypothetical protein [Halomonas]MDR5888115.1 hypothetical protein [Halomonas salina]RAH37364.1 hypothetical protein C9J49_010660 [Halomonas sp. SL1]WJY08636.1 hypothetical protein QWG60_06955 [Halomonas halophila]GEK72271.1 hypothetical protein HHA04nite_08150 [Halomonas halophila]
MISSHPLPRRPLIVGDGVAALRLRQAARELGITTYSAEGEPEGLVARARELGCDALHPGETPPSYQWRMATACREAGLRFLGQSKTLLAAMTDEGTMRRLMQEAGLPLAPVEATGPQVRVSLLADGAGRVVHLAPRQTLPDGSSLAPLAWLTPERSAYLGRLAGQGVAALGATGLVEARFRVVDNAVGFDALAPGPNGEEALDESLFGLDPLLTQWRLWSGERLGERQSGLRARGHARLWRLTLPEGARLDGGPGVRLDSAGPGHASRLVVWGRRPGDLHGRTRRALSALLGEDEARKRLADD